MGLGAGWCRALSTAGRLPGQEELSHKAGAQFGLLQKAQHAPPICLRNFCRVPPELTPSVHLLLRCCCPQLVNNFCSSTKLQRPPIDGRLPGSNRGCFTDPAWLTEWQRYHRRNVRRMDLRCLLCVQARAAAEKQQRAAAAAAATVAREVDA